MGNFEKLSVLVIVVIIVMILVVALHTWSEKPGEAGAGKPGIQAVAASDGGEGDDAYRSDIWSRPPDREQPLDDGPLPAPGDEPEADDGGLEILDGPIDPQPADPQPVSDEPAGPREYEIQPRDTLSEIAQRECGSIRFVSEIMALNPGVDPSALRVGSKLKLPGRGGGTNTSSTRDGPGGSGSETPAPAGGGGAAPGGTYTTRAGDTFERISKRVYGNIERWPDIWAENRVAVPDMDRIPPGTQLKLPR